MKKIVCFELKKIFSKKFLIFSIGLLLVANMVNIFQTYDIYHDRFNKDSNDGEWDFYSEYEGEITQDKISRLTEYRQQLQNMQSGSDLPEQYYISLSGDRWLVDSFLEQIQNALGYKESMQKILNDNLELENTYKNVGNEYLTKIAELIKKTYTTRSIHAIYNTKAYDSYFSYDFSSFLLLLLIFLATSVSFAGEKEIGMLSLLRSTPGGWRILCIAKQIAVLVFVLSIGFLFYLSDFFMFFWCTRPRGITMPIYSIEHFSYSPLTMTIGNYIMLSAFLKLLGLSVFGLISCAISSIFDKGVFVFVADLFLLFGLMLMSVYSARALRIFNIFNPISLLTNRELFYYFDVTNIAGVPILEYKLVVLCAGVVFMSFFGLTLLLNSPNVKSGGKSR